MPGIRIPAHPEHRQLHHTLRILSPPTNANLQRPSESRLNPTGIRARMRDRVPPPSPPRTTRRAAHNRRAHNSQRSSDPGRQKVDEFIESVNSPVSRKQTTQQSNSPRRKQSGHARDRTPQQRRNDHFGRVFRQSFHGRTGKPDRAEPVSHARVQFGQCVARRFEAAFFEIASQFRALRSQPGSADDRASRDRGSRRLQHRAAAAGAFDQHSGSDCGASDSQARRTP